MRPLARALRLSLEADAALPAPAPATATPAIGFLRAEQRAHHRRPRLPDRDARRQRAPRRAARGGVRRAGRATGAGPRCWCARPSSGVTVDPRAVVTEQVGELSLQFTGGRLLPEQPVPAAAAGRARRRRGAARAARASWSTPTAAAACSGLAAAPQLRARAGRRGERERGRAGRATTPPATDATTASSSPPTPARCSPTVPFARRRRGGDRRSAAQGVRRRLPAPAGRVRAAHDRLCVVQPRDAGARPRARWRAAGYRCLRRTAVRHVPADPPRRGGRHARPTASASAPSGAVAGVGAASASGASGSAV